MSNLTKTDRELSIFEEYSKEQLNLIKNQIAKGSTDIELAMFLSICKKRDLDPFSNQIWFIKYNSNKPIITASIDGLRSIAERTGELDGQQGPLWCGDDGVWKDVWLSNTNPSACKVKVYRKDCKAGFTGIALWKEFNNPKNQSWKNFPTVMLAKCAEAAALRKAFPQVTSGIYEQSEIKDLSNDTVVVREAETVTVQEVETVKESSTFNIKQESHKKMLIELITKYGAIPEEIPAAEKSNLVLSLKNVDLEHVPAIIERFLKERSVEDASA